MGWKTIHSVSICSTEKGEWQGTYSGCWLVEHKLLSFCRQTLFIYYYLLHLFITVWSFVSAIQFSRE